ncbi:hypothetical protein IMCC3135_32885 [Granulosicoccus antarcticus IMCC3135]|uniref:Uncharacterized protein n=1 Tax=Granulosicoccus antarcticus IMCC3135 TaxID=1192854 RepID=A0A2Z2NYV8_9GAMM|nr:hypothetical protein IMCC3135_01060 [Granulosicoccus antarcticus IMCC3135]ASJ76622.1 hypothetical protein IMCC3135_32885 [Granulosicoccus antarcticus IMCC3135]
MISCRLLSGQSYTWSDNYAGYFDHSTQAPAQATVTQNPTVGYCSTWLADRTLQTLRQTKLQVRYWPGTRPEVLLVDQPHGGTPRHGLRPTRHSAASGRVSCQLSRDPRQARSIVRDQSGVVAPSGTVLGAGGECLIYHAHRHLRYHCRRNTDGQHARGLVARAHRFLPPCGGVYR